MNLKKITLSITALFALLVFSAPQAAEYKIGYVDGAVLLDKSPLTAESSTHWLRKNSVMLL